jgi:hypothetical protein
MSNPHRVGLGQLAFRVLSPAGAPGEDPPEANWGALQSLRGELDMWGGAFHSTFTLAPPAGTDPFCESTGEAGDLLLQCAFENATISDVLFASYGALVAQCPAPRAGCTAPNSTAVVEGLCLGKNSCSIPSGNAFWGDPCLGTPKTLTVLARCSAGGGYRGAAAAAAAAAAAPLDSTFAVAIDTAVHPDVDLVATRLSCARIGGAQPCPTALRLALPFADGRWGASANNWDAANDAAHQTDVTAAGPGFLRLAHYMDDFQAEVRCDWDDASWTMTRTAAHAFTLSPPRGAAAAVVQLSCLWAPSGAVYPVGNVGDTYVVGKAAATLALLRGGAPLPLFEPAVSAAAAAAWGAFWRSGAAVDLAGATGGTDASAAELERRVVLSQYLTRANSAGMTPPQETGLLSNSWSGRFHLEMRWWHQAHFPLWGRPAWLDRSHAFYWELLENATSLATQQGLRGARWQKMLALANRANRSSSISVPWLGEGEGFAPPAPGHEDGLLLLWESANNINPVLTWNQGPVAWLAEAIRLATNFSQGAAAALAVVQRLAPLVLATGDAYADLPFLNETSGCYEIGPPTLGAEEFGSFLKIRKPLWETVYAAVALDIANEWRELLGQPRDAKSDAVAGGLCGLPLDPAQSAPTYAFNAEAACCYNASCPPGRFGGRDQCDVQAGHPSPAAVLGLLNGRRRGDRYGVDAATANTTVATIAYSWKWSDGAGWGWDTPLVAMGQARNNWAPEATVAMLLMPGSHNAYWRTGWNWQ